MYNNITNRLLIVISIFILVFTVNCEKEEYQCSLDDNASSSLYSIDSVIKEYAFFDTGSYWIYKEQNTGSIDTVTVISSYCIPVQTILKPTLDNEYNCETTNVSIEACQVDYRSSYYELDFTEQIFNAGVRRELNKCGYIKKETVMEEMSFYEHDFYCCKKIAFLDVNGNQFNNIIKKEHPSKIYNKCDDMVFWKTIVYYHAKNYGLIKRENLTDGEVWELIDYNIVQ